MKENQIGDCFKQALLCCNSNPHSKVCKALQHSEVDFAAKPLPKTYSYLIKIY